LEVAHRELPPLSGESAAPAAEITFSDITKFYHLGYHKTLKANEAVSFEAGKAEIVALVGESGCGKSTLARIVTGLD
ncbi:MAG: ATP-binding cassette domain-containing protein, partial [Mesorhizobium sp.]